MRVARPDDGNDDEEEVEAGMGTGTGLPTVRRPLRVVLLDLDGTLTRSDPGIIASVQRTFRTIGMPEPNDAELHRFIGPAIISSLRRNHVPEALLPHAVDTYRRYYNDEAVFEDPNHPGHKVPGRLANTVYPGIPEQLAAMRGHGYFLAVATCKPEYQARPICDHFRLTPMVDGIYGASSNNSRLDKDQVIRYCFQTIGMNSDKGDRAVMVGDRWTDVDGAKALAIDTIGCRWGYAEPGELEAHGVYQLIDRVDQLGGAIDDYFRGHQSGDVTHPLKRR